MLKPFTYIVEVWAESSGDAATLMDVRFGDNPNYDPGIDNFHLTYTSAADIVKRSREKRNNGNAKDKGEA